MTPRTDTVPPLLMSRLELAGNRALNLTLRDLSRRAATPEAQYGYPEAAYDYPVAAIVLDGTGNIKLGEGVSRDRLTGDTTAHAEVNALRSIGETRTNFRPRIMVSTVDSCIGCQGKCLRHMGNDAIIASVFSRTDAEALGHVTHRLPTTPEHAEGLRFVRLPHPRLQAKANLLFGEHVTRNPETQVTNVLDIPRLLARSAEIDRQYPLY